MTRPVPQAAIDLVKQVEGLRLTAYQDVGGVWTIGYGSTGDVLAGQTISQETAQAFLESDLTSAANRLSGVVDDPVIQALTDNQYSALLSFVFNLGANPSWTIWKVLNAKQFDQVPAQLIRFVYAGQPPVKVQGLVNRRTAEINLWSLDEPGSVDTSPSSSVTRSTATPAVPIDPKPKGLGLAIGTAATLAAPAIANLQSVAQTVSDAITPYQNAAQIFGHVIGALSVVGGGCAVALLVLKYLRDRESKAWGKTSAPALHPTVLASESNMNPNPPPGGTVVGQAQPIQGGPLPTAVQVATAQVQPPQEAVPGGAGSVPVSSDLSVVRDTLGRCLANLGGQARAFAGKTVSEIVAEIKELAALVESKL